MEAAMADKRTDRIRRAFGAAAEGYEDSAAVQRIVAETVAKLAAQRRLPDRLRLLEIGCGTGFLTRHIRAQWPQADLAVTDLAPEMVERASRDPRLSGTFFTMDGQWPCFEGQWFDLIVSSMAFQWFDDLAGALERLFALLRPGGSLIFSTMAERSFGEWRVAHAACGLFAGTPDYPSLETLREMVGAYPDGAAFDEDYAVDFGSGRAFLTHLKAIGATVPAEGRTPLSAAALRRVIRAFEDGGARATYHVGFVRVSRV
ncbi:MAG: methyltransferase domain-containing protein [Alphaproteobacteria bacterium]|nr:methyltransferase domain-containing protein [Alphaproteobacteria bacterium]